MTVEELYEGTRKVAKDFYSNYNLTKRIVKIISVTKNLSGIIPIGTNLSFKRYYSKDLNF